MISMAAVGGAGAAASYYTKDNYYTDRDASEASAWAGQGAVAAGLAGEIDVDAFKAVLEGRLPDGSIIPTGRNDIHTPGMDLTFSAPKSLSMLAYIGGDERLLEANMAAVRETLAWAEKNLAETRVSKDGKVTIETTGKLIVGLFQHDTNRNLDPQAHVHAVIANATQSKDGTWRALHNGKLWQNNTLLGSIYHAALRERVEALGYSVTMQGKYGTFEIAGIDRKAIEAFSTRRTEILATAAEKLDHASPQGLRAVTVRTRAAKSEIEDRGDLRAEWRERAVGLGLDLTGIVAAARDGRTANPWEKLTDGLSKAADTVRTVVGYVADRLGLGRNELDPFMPDKPGRLCPADLGASTAVASALRHLSQREAAFDLHALYKSALELGLPVTISSVEKAVATLQADRKLVPGSEGRENKITTPAAIALERAIVAGALRDHGTSPALVESPAEAGRQLQSAANARNGFTLNEGQENAGRLILASHDRVFNIQGVAGSGKSSVLAPVADVARAAGHNILLLGLQNVLVNDLGQQTGIDAMTIDKFIGRHKLLLDPRTFTERVDLARGMFGKSVVVVDEASMVSNAQMKTLLDLANKLDFKLALVGDSRQLGAVDAGKPFEVLQGAGVSTAQMTENLRARTADLHAAAGLANSDRTVAAFNRLGRHTTEAPGRMVEEAVARWIGKPEEQRDRTILLASGRAVREGLNLGVQAALVKAGKIGGASTALTVVDNANLTREQERFASNYTVGQAIEIARRIPSQRIEAGHGRITRVDYSNGIVEITRADGRTDNFEPGRLSPRRVENNFKLGTEKQLTIHEGDRIRWTATDNARGLFNAGKATVSEITRDAVIFDTGTGMTTSLKRDDPQLARLDLGYAMNAHGNQGVTADYAIGVIDSRETNLTNGKLFLVQVTRARDGLELIVNDIDRVAGALLRNPGEKTSALETIGLGRPAPGQAIANASAGQNQPKPPPDITPEIPVLERTRTKQLDFGL
jgi:conjugative relaxase-like TrwC/TraI family protein